MGKTSTCKDCGNIVSKAARRCPHCGSKGPSYSRNSCHQGCAVLALVGLLVVVFLALVGGQ